MLPPTIESQLVERERQSDIRWGVYLTVREMERAARAVAHSNTLADQALAQRLHNKAHHIRAAMA